MERKIRSFKLIESFNTYIIYIQEEYTNVSKQLDICIHCSLNKQYMEGIQNGQNAYLMITECTMIFIIS